MNPRQLTPQPQMRAAKERKVRRDTNPFLYVPCVLLRPILCRKNKDLVRITKRNRSAVRRLDQPESFTTVNRPRVSRGSRFKHSRPWLSPLNKRAALVLVY